MTLQSEHQKTNASEHGETSRSMTEESRVYAQQPFQAAEQRRRAHTRTHEVQYALSHIQHRSTYSESRRRLCYVKAQPRIPIPAVRSKHTLRTAAAHAVLQPKPNTVAAPGIIQVQLHAPICAPIYHEPAPPHHHDPKHQANRSNRLRPALVDPASIRASLLELLVLLALEGREIKRDVVSHRFRRFFYRVETMRDCIQPRSQR